MGRGQPGQDPISKLTRTKWTRGVTQAVECLLCKPETLTSSPSPKEKNNNHFNGCRKSLWQNSTTLHDKKP
jgi:hypothetical protein